MRVAHSVVVLVAAANLAAAQGPSFPDSVITNQDKMDWLTTQVDAVAHSVEAEAEKQVPDQREVVYRAALARAVELNRLLETIPGRLPRLEGRVNETIAHAVTGLERIENERLVIGMTAQEVREIRGEPAHVDEVTTPAGVREQWRYGRTILSFENGKLVEIRQTLKTD